jgi:hypothetical protein
MDSFSSLLLFALSVIGMTNIIVDPATIMQPTRDFIERRFHPWINKLVSCYQCSGTWVGFLFGYILVGKDPLVVFSCGMAGSFLATASATYMNYLEAKSVVGTDLDE